VVAIFLISSSLFSSPNLSGRRLDDYHTSAPGVALDANLECRLKCAACGSLEIQDAKMTQKIAIWAPCRILSGYILATKACIDNRQKLVKQQYHRHVCS